LEGDHSYQLIFVTLPCLRPQRQAPRPGETQIGRGSSGRIWTRPPFGKDSGWRCPHRLGNGFGTATRTSPPRCMRGRCQDAPGSSKISVSSSPCRFRFRCRCRSRSRRVRQGQPTGFLVISRRVAVVTGRGARGDAGLAIAIGIGIGLHTLTRACSPAPEARQTIDPGVSPGSPDPPVRAPAGRQNPGLEPRTLAGLQPRPIEGRVTPRGASPIPLGEGTRPTVSWLVINERFLSSLVAKKGPKTQSTRRVTG
jgi:hypothetical protein